MTRIHAGAVLDRPPGPKYVESLRFAELSLVGPPPKPATMERWRQDLPPGFTLALVLPRAALRSARGPLRFDETTEAAFEWSTRAAEALQADFIVVPTGSEVTTGQRDRDRLAEWFARWRSVDPRRLVWHPSGLWDAEIAAPFARRLDVILGFDPLSVEPPAGVETLYARLKAIGMRNRFTETLLLDALESLSGAGAEEAWVALESPRSFNEARRLAQLAAELESELDGELDVAEDTEREEDAP